MTLLTFTPLDTLFFRDGRPYNKDESNAQVFSVFPPFSPTLIGAARAAYARALGWPDKDWETHVKPHFGDGTDLNPVSFDGPYLLRESQPVFPVPALLVKTPHGNLARLSPGPERQCDLGKGIKVRLPELRSSGSKHELASGWLIATEMTRVLAGGLPKQNEVLKHQDLFLHERGIGNWRDGASRTVQEDNAVYSPAHVRLARNVELGLKATGLPDFEPANPAPTAGESRLCWISREEREPDLPVAPKIETANGILRYCVILITPLDIEETVLPKPNVPYANLPGKLVSACIRRSQRAGGWFGKLAGSGEPQPLRTLLPAGSVFFLEADAATVDAVLALHRTKIGTRTEWGFGQILIGVWGNE
ncbi:MAG: type III-B CRISPR module-associated Cmr3 family protein [Methylococcales bacterium]